MATTPLQEHVYTHSGAVARAFPTGENQNYIVVGQVGAGKSALIRTAMALLKAEGAPPESKSGGLTHTRIVTAFPLPDSSLRLIDCPGLESAAESLPMDVWGAMLQGGLHSNQTELLLEDERREWKHLSMAPAQQQDADKLHGVVVCVHGPSLVHPMQAVRDASLQLLHVMVRMLKRAREHGCAVVYAVTQCDGLPDGEEPATLGELDRHSADAVAALQGAIRAFGAPPGHIMPCVSYPGLKEKENWLAEASVLELLRALDRDPPPPPVLPTAADEQIARVGKLTAALVTGPGAVPPPGKADDIDDLV